MLAGLGHHTLVGGDHQHNQIHATNPGYHGAHEFLMPRYIDDAEMDPARKVESGKAEFNGDAT